MRCSSFNICFYNVKKIEPDSAQLHWTKSTKRQLKNLIEEVGWQFSLLEKFKVLIGWISQLLVSYNK